MKIRKAKKNDLKKILEIFSEGIVDEFKTQYPGTLKKEILEEKIKIRKKKFKNFNKEINSKNYYWIVGEIEKEIIGFANAKISEKKDGWLRMNYIKKEFRGEGIGKKLVEERINWLKKRKIKKFYARAFVNNKQSTNNLEKFGFKPLIITFEKK